MNPAIDLAAIQQAFDSIIRADYISLDDEEKMAQLESYYVDFFGHLPAVLRNQDNYISGRRGTGKTSILLRAYLECLHSLNGKSSHIAKPVLPLYIDLSQCRKILGTGAKSQIETAFVQQVLMDILAQVREMSKHKFVSSLSRKGGQSNNLLQNAATTQLKEFLDNLNLPDSTATVRDLLEIFKAMKTAAGVSAIYVFIDEFSDLSEEEQLSLALLLRKLLGSKVDTYFKIAVITDHYNFGPYIRLQRDIFQVPLDLSDHVERLGGTVPAMKRLEDFTRRLIVTRLETFDTKLTAEKLFERWDEAIERLAAASMGVSRTLGVILQAALLQANTRSRPPLSRLTLSVSDVNYGITHAYRSYARAFEGQIKQHILPSFYADLWRALREAARTQRKNRKEKRPVSHFMVSEQRAHYLNVLTENFLVHTLESNKVSRAGESNHLFSFDRGVCDELNLGYAGSRYDLTHDWLIFDDVVQTFDDYFTKSKTTLLRCPECKTTYKPETMARFKVKRCQDCDCQLEEEKGQEAVQVNLHNFTEEERKIAGAIAMLTRADAKSARVLADEIGCSVQKVAAFSRVLKRKSMVKTQKDPAANRQLYYFEEA